MKLDINRIEELKKENEMLDQKEDEIVAMAKKKANSEDFNDWYRLCKDDLSKIDDKKRANKEMMIIIKATNVNVGDGISLSPYTDWDAYTIIERKDTPKGFVLTIQEDKAIRTDGNGMSDSQEYRFERNENGSIKTIRWNPRSNWFSANGYKVALGRHSYYDYSF